MDVVYKLAKEWESLPGSSFKPQPSDIEGLTANQIVVFLEQFLTAPKPLSPELSKLMGEVYGLTTTNNIEVANLYCQVGLKAGDKSVLAPAADLLGRIGRMKFVRPLYVMPSPQPTPRLYPSIMGNKPNNSHQVPQPLARRPQARSRDLRKEQGLLPSHLSLHGRKGSVWEEGRLS